MNITQHELQIVHEIYRHICLNLHIRIHVSTLISQHQIPQRTVTQAYKHLFNKTPQQHHLEEMMAHAKKRVSKGEQIKCVAIDLGYSSTTNFSRTFKKVYGQPPSNYLPR